MLKGPRLGWGGGDAPLWLSFSCSGTCGRPLTALLSLMKNVTEHL